MRLRNISAKKYATKPSSVTELTEQFYKVGVGDHVVAELAVRSEALHGERRDIVARRVLEAVLVVGVAPALPHLKVDQVMYKDTVK